MRKLASIRKITELKPIEGADRIEVAVVDGWKCVVKKGDFSVSEIVIYCEIDSFLPIREEFEFLRKSSFKKMDDQEGFRLRTIRLRGQVSQGLLLPLSTLGSDAQVVINEDVTSQLGIVKYEPPIPACLSGDVVGPFPASISRTDEERIQNLANEFDSYRGKSFYVTEKIDGTSFTAFFNDSEFGVCGRNWQLSESDVNTHWRIAKQLELPEKMARLNRHLALQGELTGPGIQGNPYQLKEHAVFAFNVFDIEAYAYLEKAEMEEVCAALGVCTVPVMGTMQVPASIDEILEMAEGKSVLNATTEREGLVWVAGSGNERISFKTISNRFLAKEK